MISAPLYRHSWRVYFGEALRLFFCVLKRGFWGEGLQEGLQRGVTERGYIFIGEGLQNRVLEGGG